MAHNETRGGLGLLTIGEVAAELRIGKPSTYRLVADGKLNAYRIGRRLRFTPADVQTYLDGQRTGTKGPAP
jgi:excisionase family DNA binding protein